MFTVEDRERTRELLITAAQQSDRIVGAAHVGSFVTGRADRWSDIDMALAVDDINVAVTEWTELMEGRFEAVHHWDLVAPEALYRVFLLGNGLEVDIAFTRAESFARLGPAWRTVFGRASDPPTEIEQPADPRDLVGRCWHHVLHATAAIGRSRPWQAEWMLAEARHHLATLACQRHGCPSAFGKGTDDLPDSIQARLAPTLVRELSRDALRLNAHATAAALDAELRDRDDPIGPRLVSVLIDALAALDAQ